MHPWGEGGRHNELAQGSMPTSASIVVRFMLQQADEVRTCLAKYPTALLSAYVRKWLSLSCVRACSLVQFMRRVPWPLT